jgi:hypothetical protein
LDKYTVQTLMSVKYMLVATVCPCPLGQAVSCGLINNTVYTNHSIIF